MNMQESPDVSRDASLDPGGEDNLSQRSATPEYVVSFRMHIAHKNTHTTKPERQTKTQAKTKTVNKASERERVRHIAAMAYEMICRRCVNTRETCVLFLHHLLMCVCFWVCWMLINLHVYPVIIDREREKE